MIGRAVMTAWTEDELGKIAASDDLQTYGTPTWIWSVVVDGALYARAYNGKASRWYQAANRQRAGQISTAGINEGSEV